jgi:hypothetical protein
VLASSSGLTSQQKRRNKGRRMRMQQLVVVERVRGLLVRPHPLLLMVAVALHLPLQL